MQFSGDKTLVNLTFAVIHTPAWSPRVALVMIACNLFAIAVGYYAIKNRGVGPKLPLEMPAMFTGFGIPELLATASFGHLLGVGLILGLGNAGVL
ncbi:photosystem I reaction center subunit PsaK [Phormidium tenue FACHB-886]|nr:photosystem I reaction center subunit PsaK [Phormidium tenue FACHB-886]